MHFFHEMHSYCFFKQKLIINLKKIIINESSQVREQ